MKRSTEELIERILTSGSFRDDPPVCVDIGASGALPADWTLLAKHSICVAFDADSRDFTVEESTNTGWRRLLKLNRIVAARAAPAVAFHLTKSPHCSSTLPPDMQALKSWAFVDLFETERTVSLPAVSLPEVLTELEIGRVDWFKTDSQGTDLRILASLPDSLIDAITVAEFEPGIIDAYVGEDKLFTVMAFMNDRPFFLSDMDVKGSQRIGKNALGSLNEWQRRFLDAILKESPGWAEISYLNDFSRPSRSPRDLLLGWVCSTIKKQDGHALAIAEIGTSSSLAELFFECRAASLRELRSRALPMAYRMIRRGIGSLLRR
jgi:hypothetical protein